MRSTLQAEDAACGRRRGVCHSQETEGAWGAAVCGGGREHRGEHGRPCSRKDGACPCCLAVQVLVCTTFILRRGESWGRAGKARIGAAMARFVLGNPLVVHWGQITVGDQGDQSSARKQLLQDRPQLGPPTCSGCTCP